MKSTQSQWTNEKIEQIEIEGKASNGSESTQHPGKSQARLNTNILFFDNKSQNSMIRPRIESFRGAVKEVGGSGSSP